jgi:hypothetical protein
MLALSPSAVILSEALDRKVQDEAKNLSSSLGASSTKDLGGRWVAQEPEIATAEILRPSAEGLRMTVSV